MNRKRRQCNVGYDESLYLGLRGSLLNILRWVFTRHNQTKTFSRRKFRHLWGLPVLAAALFLISDKLSVATEYRLFSGRLFLTQMKSGRSLVCYTGVPTSIRLPSKS